MHACPRCWEVIEHPLPVSEGSLIYEATGTEDVVPPAPVVSLESPDVHQAVQVVTLPTEHVAPHVPIRHAPRRRSGVGRLVLIGLVSGVLLTAGFLALEAVVPQLRETLPSRIALSEESFPGLGFAISVPDGWDVREEDVDSKPGVVIFEPARSGSDAGLRRLNVVRVDRSLDAARDLAGTRAPASARNYEEIDITDGLRVDGRRAFRHRYTDGEEYREEWWIQAGAATFRIEFASPVSHREESAGLFVRIARSFDVL